MNKPFSLLRSRALQTLIVLPFISSTLLINTPTTVVQAAGVVDRVDINDGFVDVNEDGIITTADDATNVLLAFNDAALIYVDIRDGSVDVNKSGVIAGGDDLLNADLTREGAGNTRISDQVDIINARVDVNEDGSNNTADDLTDVRLLR